MHRPTRAAVLTVALVLLTTGTAGAKDMNGKFGVGFLQTLGGVTGMSFRYWATRHIGIEADIGLGVVENELGTSTEVLFAFGIFYALVQHRKANLLIGLRGDLGVRVVPTVQQAVRVQDAVNTENPSTTAEKEANPFQINIEIPLVAEFFFSDSFSVHLSFGAVLIIVPEDGQLLETTGPGIVADTDDIGFRLGAGGLLGSAGFTYYF